MGRVFGQWLRLYVLFLASCVSVIGGNPQDEGKPAAYHDRWSEELFLDQEHPEGQERPIPPVPTKRDPPRIFIGTAAYRDMECPGTLFNAFQNAKHPEKLYMGVVDQVDFGDEDCEMGYCRMWQEKLNDTSVCPYFQHIKLTRIPSKDAAGPTKARHFQGDLIDGQDFCMQVDSHTLFTEHWDVKMIEMWKMTQNENAVITTYLPGAENYRKENMANRHEVPHICNLMWSSSGVLRNSIAAAAANLPRPKLTTIWAAGLSFSKCHAELAVPYDPNLPQAFDGEEISKAARLFTHGYDLYTPHINYIWHNYKRRRRGEWYADAGRKSQDTVEVKDPDTEVDVGKKMSEDKERSHKRLMTLFQMPGGSGEDLGEYGLGNKRTLDQFLRFVGVNLTTHEIYGKRCGNLVWVPHNKEQPKEASFKTQETVAVRADMPQQAIANVETSEDSNEFKLESVVEKMALNGEEVPVDASFIGASHEDPSEIHAKIMLAQQFGTVSAVAVCVLLVIAFIFLNRESFGQVSRSGRRKGYTTSYGE